MHKRIRRKKRRKYIYLFSIMMLVIGIVLFFKKDAHIFVASDNLDSIEIVDDNKSFYFYDVPAGSVGDLLDKYVTDVSDEDRVFPSRDSQVFSGDSIFINRKKKVTVVADGEEKVLETFGDSIENIFKRNNINLDENDIVIPQVNTIVRNDVEAKITRVEFKEETETKKIPFETVLKKDDELNFLKKYTKQEGENGSKELIYKVAYHDGKEVDRALVEEKVVKEAVDKVVVQGTKVKLGKKHKGVCSWYSNTGTMSAANQWLPKGSYVKVTNKANGKSVIVQINDRGPFVPGRIIDLDKVAFAKIASIGAGVIDVKMEEVVQ